MNWIIINFIESILMTWFITSLLAIEPKKKTRLCLIMALMNFSIITLSNFIFVYDFLLTTYLILINSIIAYHYSENEYHEALFIVCLESVFVTLVNSITIVIYDCLQILDLGTISKFLYFIFAYGVLKFLKHKQLYFNKQLYYILSFMILGLQQAMAHFFMIYTTNENKYDGIVVTFILLIVCIAVMIYVIFKMSDLYKTSQSYERMMQEKNNEMILHALYDEVKITKHDLKHDFNLLYDYLHKKEYEKIEEYLKNRIDSVNDIPVLIHSQNELINTILNNKVIEAYAKNIKLSCRLSIENNLNIKEYELNDLLCNILDNAIENCSSSGDIDCCIIQENESLQIEVTNTIQTSTDLSTKKDKKNHGFGLKSIKRIVNRYHGVVGIEQTDTQFVLKATLLLIK